MREIKQGGGDRRRHHGRRHRDELPQRRHPGDDARDEAGGARQGRRRRSARTTRRRSRRASSSRTSSTSAWRLLTHHAQLRRHQGRRPRDRGRVRGHGRQGAGVQDARRGDEARRDPGLATPRRSTSNKIAAFTKRPQDVIGMHFFSPANVMKLLEVVRGEKTAKDVLATVMALAKKIKKTGGRLRRVRRLHRQPHDRAVLAPGRLPAGGGRHAAAGRQGDREVRLRDGPVPHGRPGRQRHRLGHPQAPLRREARHALLARPPTCCASWAASARRPAPAGTTTQPGKRDAIPSRWSTR